MTSTVDVQKLLPWIQQSLKDRDHLLAKGYQGQTLLYVDGALKIVIKTPHGSGLIKYFHTRMLRHEYNVYQQLQGITGVPKCYGLIADTYLAIEYIEANTIRENRPADDSVFYDDLLDTIKQLHARKVAHTDLKKKENLLVSKDEKPYIIDFGAAVIYKPGLHFLNHYFYNLACRFDFNAWIKHKYMGRMDVVSESDKRYYDRSIPEKLASKIKRKYLLVKKRFIN